MKGLELENLVNREVERGWWSSLL